VLGLTLTSFVIENISLPEEVEKRIDKRTSMGVVGDLNKYSQYQAAEAMREAANNPCGGMAGMGRGHGRGRGDGADVRPEHGRRAAAGPGGAGRDGSLRILRQADPRWQPFLPGVRRASDRGEQMRPVRVRTPARRQVLPQLRAESGLNSPITTND
jgi:hypothetical protein